MDVFFEGALFLPTFIWQYLWQPAGYRRASHHSRCGNAFPPTRSEECGSEALVVYLLFQASLAVVLLALIWRIREAVLNGACNQIMMSDLRETALCDS